MSAGLSRRTLLRGSAGAVFGIASVGVLPLFGTPNRTQDPEACTTEDRSRTDKRFVISNWPEYVDEDDGDYKSTLTLFEEEFGIDVRYTPDVNDNVEFLAKVINQLGACQPTKRDMFVLTNWMAARTIEMGWIQKINRANVPNLHANLIDALQVDWDSERDYSAPWQSGFTGIAYNKDRVKEVKSIDDLLTRSELKGRVTMLTEMRDTMGLVLLSEGADPASFTGAEWERSIEKVRKAVASGQIRRFTGNDYIDDLAAGNVLACVAWSGDVANAGYDNIEFVMDVEGGPMIWADNMLIPNLAPHQENAETWIDYYYRPDVAAELANYNNYICPVIGAQEIMAERYPDQAESQYIFPSEETLATSHAFMALDKDQTRTYEGDFADVIGG